MLGAVRVDRAASTLVTRVHGCQQVDDFAAADLADNKAVGTHPQCLPHQVAEIHAARTLGVGKSGLETYDVWMLRPQFGRILHENDPFRRID